MEDVPVSKEPDAAIASEIEITPEMIEAGEREYWAYGDLSLASAADVVEIIFTAMASVSPLQSIGRESIPQS